MTEPTRTTLVCRQCLHYRTPNRCRQYGRTDPHQPADTCPSLKLPTGQAGTCASCRHWPGFGAICDAGKRHASGSVRDCRGYWPRRPTFRVKSANVIASDAPEFELIGEGRNRTRSPLPRFRREPAKARLH
jgi:hypothetical protein